MQGYMIGAGYHTCLGMIVVRLGNFDVRRGYEADVMSMISRCPQMAIACIIALIMRGATELPRLLQQLLGDFKKELSRIYFETAIRPKLHDYPSLVRPAIRVSRTSHI